MLHQPLPHTMLTHAAVQAEWTNTLDRIQQLCPLRRAAEVVRPDKFAYITLDEAQEHHVPTIESYLFQNLLLRPLYRIEHRGTIEFQADWLWNWRQNAPWIIDQASSANRLFPDAPDRMFIYRFNLVLVEVRS